MNLEEEVKYAGDMVHRLKKDNIVRIIGHVDADGISSASIVAISLARLGYKFHISIKRTSPNLIDEISKGENALTIFVDIGTSYLKEMNKIKGDVIVLDHHLIENDETRDIEDIIYINPRKYGIDASKEGSASCIAYEFAKAIDKNNIDLSQLAVVGMIGDKQKFTGLNKKIVEEGIGNGFISEKEQYLLRGGCIKEMIDNSIDPYFVFNSTHFLNSISIKPESKLNDLNEEERKRFFSALTLKMIEQNVEEIEWKRIQYYGKEYGNLHDMASKLDACARLNEAGVGIALCFRDKNAQDKAKMIQEKYRDEIRKELKEIEKKEVNEMKNFLYIYVNHAPLAGVIAGLSLKYIPKFKKGKPVVAIAVNDDASISARGNDRMVENGINLGKAFKIAAEKVGGIGGGHQIAAGAKIKKERLKEFLEELDKELG
ncbi:MAG: DHH family phosphoesterase [Thermoplasmatales archaeon]|nr:DHH family phosphoesterase [Thermoplasmatales archaeon]